MLGLGLAAGGFYVLRWRTPAPTTPVPRPAPPAVESRKPALQADAEGFYVPGYEFTVNRVRFTGVTLRPDPVVTFAQRTGGAEQVVPCLEAVIRAETVHLRCDDPQVGTVTIDGKFLTRSATSRLDTPVLSAVVTVRTGSGEILYRARDSFKWHPGDSSGAGP
jgi:hypothetical protein